MVNGQNPLDRLASKQLSKTQLFSMAEADFSLLPVLFLGTSSSKASVRYGCASVLVDLSEKHPDRLYPCMEKFVEMLDSKHRILIWNGLAAVANLTTVDVNRKFDTLFERYYSFLSSEYMVTVANTVVNSARIATNKPYLADRIAA